MMDCCCGKMLANSRFIPDPACKNCERLEVTEKRTEFNSILDAIGGDVAIVIQEQYYKLALGPQYIEHETLEQILQEISDAMAAEQKMGKITFAQAVKGTEYAIETYKTGLKYKPGKKINKHE